MNPAQTDNIIFPKLTYFFCLNHTESYWITMLFDETNINDNYNMFVHLNMIARQ